jgi:TatD DNase family protein
LRLIDAHVHLSDEEYIERTDELINDARNAGISALVTNSTDLKTCENDIKLSQKYPNLVYPALGIHPWNINALKEHELQETLDLIQKQKSIVKAIGEIGLDSKYQSMLEKQALVFDKMLHIAESLDLPAIIHSRGATEKILEMLPSYNVKRVLLHWFSYPMTALAKAMDRGYFITEGPPVTYSNGIREVVEKTPLANLLTETDGPVRYWKKPFNGQLTKPSFIRNVVAAVAEIKRMQIEDVAEQIAKNFEVFFGIQLN